MKIYFCVVFNWIIFFSSTKKVSGIDTRRIPEVDALIELLQEDAWDENDKSCLQDTLALLNNVKNSTLWATWIWDANQRPSGHLYGSSHQLGNFDQCMNPPWLSTHPHLRTQYCYSEITLSADAPREYNGLADPYQNTEEYIKTESKYRIHYNKLYWGVCVPAECSARAVAKLLRHMYLGSHYAPVVAAPRIAVELCQRAGETKETSTAVQIFIPFITILFITALASTWYRSGKANIEENQGTVGVITELFCMRRNYNELFKLNSNEIGVLHGIRFISAIGVVLVHGLMFVLFSPVINFNMLEENFTLTSFKRYFFHIDIFVDTFLAMSGLLYMRGLMTHIKKHENLLLVLCKRYFRLIGPLALSVYFITFVNEEIGSGPVWRKLNGLERTLCENNGWIFTLLMTNRNSLDMLGVSSGFESNANQCNMVTWYISCDYQLTLLATVLFFLYRKNRRLGFVAFSIASVLALLIPGVLAYVLKLSVVPIQDIRSLTDVLNNTELKYNYLNSYVRAGAYLVGCALGFLMSHYKPDDYRCSVSKKWSITGVAICLSVMFCMMDVPNILSGRDYDAFEWAVVGVMNRVLWAAAVCGIIAFCEYGTVPIINDYLSLPLFVPLSRLSYGIYLFHVIVLQSSLYSTRAPVTYNLINILVNSAGVLLWACGVSLAVWMLLESPLSRLATLVFTKSRTIHGDKNGIEMKIEKQSNKKQDKCE